MNIAPGMRLQLRVLAGVGLATALVAPSASLAGDGSSWFTLGRVADAFLPPVPDNYHARLDGVANANKAGGPVVRNEVTGTERVAETALASKVAGLVVDRDDLTKFPVMVLSTEPGGVLAKATKRSLDPEQAARAFLSTNRDLYGVNDRDMSSLRVRYVTSPEGGATIVKFDQVIDGIPVFGDDLSVVMTKANDIVATSGRFYPQVVAANGVAAHFTLPQTDAIIKAVYDLTGHELAMSDFDLTNANAPGGYKVYGFSPDRAASSTKFFSDDTRIRSVLFPLGPGRFVPAYYLEVWVSGDPPGSGPVFSYVIGAENGELLFRNNLRQYDTFNYRTYANGSGDRRPWDGPTGTIGTPHPTGAPNGYQAPFIAAPLLSVESLLGPSDPWLPPSATATTGNNTDAYLDLASPDGFGTGDIRGATTSANTFDYQYDSTQNAETALNRQAAVVGMFYQVNWLHDIWYQHGFTESAGNAQTSNYGRGGVEGDSIRAEGQDLSGTDNANMAAGADGTRPKMQMYKFLASGRLNPTRDGTFDMLIVGHEMGHYISNRLIGNGNGLNNKQGGGMGEGWGDFNCILTTVQDTDNVIGTTFAIGGQTDIYWCGNSFTDNYYYSIRRYPYSSDKLKNPLTFKDIGAGITTYPGVLGDPCTSLTTSPSEVHNTGEIWAQMQWECFVGLAKAYGVATARNKMIQYYVDMMKATPTSPTFVEARNAYVAAANAANGYANPKDAQILWQAFAKRGIGTAAVAPLRTSNLNAGVVEDFSAAAALPDDTLGIYNGNVFFERDVLFGGAADQVFSYGGGSVVPLVGNWDGIGTADTPGIYDPTTGAFFLKNSNTPGPADVTLVFGAPGGVPLVGDWDGNGTTTIGVYYPSTGAFFLKNSNTSGAADISFIYGAAGTGLVPIAGDWNGDGIDSIGLYDPANGNFFLKNTNAPGGADYTFGFGVGGGVPLAGDWNSDGVDTVGFYVPGTAAFFLRNAQAPGGADETIIFGPPGAQPVAGNFDGQ